MYSIFIWEGWIFIYCLLIDTLKILNLNSGNIFHIPIVSRQYELLTSGKLHFIWAFQESFLIFRWIWLSLQEAADSLHLRNFKTSEVVLYVFKENECCWFLPSLLSFQAIFLSSENKVHGLSINFYIKLYSATLTKREGSHGASPKLTGVPPRCAFPVSYHCLPLLTCDSLGFLRRQAKQPAPNLFNMGTASSWLLDFLLQPVAAPSLSQFSILSSSFHWVWILRMLFRSVSQLWQDRILLLRRNLHSGWYLWVTWCLHVGIKLTA